MDRLHAMEVLIATVEAGSLSAAGRRLGMPLATVSRRISELEARLGARLLNRSGRKLALTEAGELYVAACRRILEDVQEAERAASGEYHLPRGDLYVTAPVVFGRLHVVPVAAEFLKAHPEIDIRLALSDRVATLLDERLDLAVRIGVLPDSGLVATRVGSIRRVVCASPAYFAARGIPKQPDDLQRHDCITFEGLSALRTWTFADGRREAAVTVRSRLAVNTAEAAIEAAVAGLGVTRVLSYQIAEAVTGGKLAMALEEFEPRPWPVNLVYAGGRLVPQKLRAFVAFAVPRLRRRLDGHRL